MILKEIPSEETSEQTINPHCRIGTVIPKLALVPNETETDEYVYECMKDVLEIARYNRVKFFATVLLTEEGAMTTAFSGEDELEPLQAITATEFLKLRLIDNLAGY